MAITCNVCNSPNRDLASYCKHCGVELLEPSPKPKHLGSSLDASLDVLVGLTELKKSITTTITFARKMKSSGRQLDLKILTTILIGSTGTGKSMIADLLAKTYFKNGILSKPDAKIINAVDFVNFAKDLAINLNNEKGGMVFIDDVHRLVPADYIPGTITPMDKLYAEMDKNNGDPIIVLASRPDGFKEYLETNPEVKNRFSQIFILPDLSAEEMCEIAIREFEHQRFTLDADAKNKLSNVFRTCIKNKDSGFGNGHTVKKIVKEIIQAHVLNPQYVHLPQVIMAGDIHGAVSDEKTTQQIIAELEELIGMEEIKAYVKTMISRIEIAKQDALLTGKTYSFGEHLLFTGNPGTGKTSLARKLGEIFYSIGLLSRGHVIEVDRSKLVGEYLGSTPKLIQKYCDDAMGGVLFIDEAYTLKNSDNDSYGQEAIDTLLKRMEDDRGKFMVIAAGYKKEMQNFINANPGLQSRFKLENMFDLKDYTPIELFKIFQRFVRLDQYQIAGDAEAKLQKTIQELYDNRSKQFANGRDMRNLYERCLSLRATRLQKSHAHDLVLIADDIPSFQDENTVMSLDDAMKALHALVGLQSVKLTITKLIDYFEVEKIRMTSGGKKTTLSTHFIFKGNPGTGKTTVARILGSIVQAMGLLPSSKVIEASRKDLVGSYVGQTENITNKKIDQALGGILFIDEAYTLSKGGTNDYGMKAIEIILERMENERGKLMVIAAGYHNEMEGFLESNPGLSSRFTHHIEFEDYTPEEMLEIFKQMVKAKDMELAEHTEGHALTLLTKLFNQRDKNFANGRTVRNLFERVLQNQAMRIAARRRVQPDVSKIINTIVKIDFA
ncbi:MAG: AAA family ATPase [Methylacidiphilales bacterium]|nr:AAA family ATPase [Candidatus Methylacidiphilales bacterium]